MKTFPGTMTIHERMIVNLTRGRLALFNTPYFQKQLRRHIKLCRHCNDLLLDALLAEAAKLRKKNPPGRP